MSVGGAGGSTQRPGWLWPLVMLGVFVAAVLLAGRSGPGIGPGSGSPDDLRLERADYEFGDCVTWDVTVPDSERVSLPIEVVPCEEPHVIEVSRSVELVGYGDDAPYPSDWNPVLKEQCRAVNEELLGAPLESSKRYRSSAIYIGRDGWEVGQRTVWCGLIFAFTSPNQPRDQLVVDSGRAAARR